MGYNYRFHMAAKKTSTERITIKPVEKVAAEITIVGESPLIRHK